MDALKLSRRSLILGAPPVLLGFPQSACGARSVAQAVDDTPMLARALARGGTVQLEAGRTYRTTATMEVKSDTRLIGGPGSIIATDGNFPAIRITGRDVELGAFTIRGDRQVHRSLVNHGIFVDWQTRPGANVYIHDVTVEQVASAGIIALASVRTRSTGLTIARCRTSFTGAHGIIAQDYIDDVLFEKNTVEASGLMYPDRPGITASRYGRRVAVRDNRCIGHPAALGNSVHGISIDQCEQATCTGNIVTGWTTGYGIEAGGIAGGSIDGNRISAGRYGIGLSGAAEAHHNSDLTVSNNIINDMSATGIFAFIHGADGRKMHERITLRSNQIAQVTGREIGIGAYLMDIDHLKIAGLSVTGCARSGVMIMDCPNYDLEGIDSHDNNLSGDPSHAGLAIHWMRVKGARRGTNRTTGNRIERNGGGRNVATYEH